MTRSVHRVTPPGWWSVLCSTTVLWASSESERISSSENCLIPALCFRESRRSRRLSLGEAGELVRSDSDIEPEPAWDAGDDVDRDDADFGSPAGDLLWSPDIGWPRSDDSRRLIEAAVVMAAAAAA